MTDNLSTIRDPELREALARLFARQTFGIKLGLEPTRQLLEAFGNPHQRLKIVHVAGTNGKGSTCAMIASALAEAGVRVGLYASPHLVDFRERMRVNGEMIPEEILALYAREMMPEIERIGCTFFEGTTAMAFRYFAEQEVDVAVLETGMGGRLDSTNVAVPIVTAVTSIGLDHTRHLGETYEAIAAEKAGIMKPGVPAVIGRVRPRLRRVFVEHAEQTGSPLIFVDDRCRALYHETSLQGTTGSFVIGDREIERLAIELPGRHQIENARVALTVLDILADRFSLDESILRRGFANIRRNTGIAGRFDLVSADPAIVFDVAHNPEGVEVLAETLRSILGTEKRVRVIFGAVRDKDVEGALRVVAPLAEHLYAVSADNPRSLPSDEIAWWGREAGMPVTDAGTVANGIESAIGESRSDDTIVVFGSFFVVGEGLGALDAMKERRATGHPATRYDAAPPEPNGVRDREYITCNSITTTDMHSPDVEFDGVSPYTPETQQRRDGNATEQYEAKRLTVKDWRPEEQPRERLIAKGAGALTTAELIAILLRTGTREKDVIQLSRELLHFFGVPKEDGAEPTDDMLLDVTGRDVKELQRIDGIGPTKAITLAAAFELARRIAVRSVAERPVIRGPKEVARIFTPRMRGLRKEQFHVMILNTAGRLIRTDLVSEGTLNSSVVHPREVFRTAIVESAASIIGVHNHPSGNPEPSREDINITKQLVEAGRIIGIPFHDHIIIAGEQYVSFADRGLL